MKSVRLEGGGFNLKLGLIKKYNLTHFYLTSGITIASHTGPFDLLISVSLLSGKLLGISGNAGEDTLKNVVK